MRIGVTKTKHLSKKGNEKMTKQAELTALMGQADKALTDLVTAARAVVTAAQAWGTIKDQVYDAVGSGIDGVRYSPHIKPDTARLTFQLHDVNMLEAAVTEWLSDMQRRYGQHFV